MVCDLRAELQHVSCQSELSQITDRGGGYLHLARELLLDLAMEHVTLEPLPYAKHALEPHIGRETVALHHGKHHAGYVKKLQELIAGKPEETASLEQMIRTSEGAIFNNAAQIWNHDFYWQSMHPDDGGVPEGALNEAIVGSFGSLERLRREFLEAGTGHFGSGWLWLVSHRDTLRITTTPDADLPLRYGDTSILCADLWEHAYYLDYHNERARYLEAFFDHLANWEFARTNWELAQAQWSHPMAGAPVPRQASRWHAVEPASDLAATHRSFAAARERIRAR